MKFTKKQIKKAIILFRKNFFLAIFITTVVFVGAIAIFKYSTSKSTFYYAKVQINYPASYISKPDLWIKKSLSLQAKQRNLLGSTDAEILNVRYYPNIDGITYSIYITVKLRGNFNKTTGNYTYQRSQIGVGSPITFNFSSSQVIGTVVDLNPNSFNDMYVKKIIYLVNRGAYYKDAPDVYYSLIIGDKYFDGTNYTFEVLDKGLEKSLFPVLNNFTGQVVEGETDTSQNIVVKAKVLLLKSNGSYIFGGNQTLRVGSTFQFSTENFNFNNFIISRIE